MSVAAGTITVALVGNPNCGKTLLFNQLSGARGSVGNYPRVTISKSEREIEYRGRSIRLVDLPGIYSMTSQSPEEVIGRDFIQNEQPDVVLNILDAGNLGRSLFLTTQLIEMGRPRVYALNMIDEAKRKGIGLDTVAMSSMLGGAVVETAAVNGQGLEQLLDAVVESVERHAKLSPMVIPYDRHQEAAIEKIKSLFAELHPQEFNDLQSRWLAIKLLEGDDELLLREGDHAHLIELVHRESFDLARQHGEDSEVMFANSRYGFIHGLLAEVMTTAVDPAQRLDLTRQIDNLLLHRTFGLPIFLGLLWLMFETTFTLGTYPMDWIDAAVAWVSGVVTGLLPDGLIRDLVVDGILAGVGGTLVFLPNIVILFFFMAVFSDTGYLARSAFLLDRLMHSFGLHGKAFIPLVMGFGCNVPAVMACRTIESPRARLIAILINPYMACTARLPVFVLFAGAFFSHMAGTMVFAMYMLSIVMAMLVAVFLSKVVVRGGDEPFVMELPPYRLPTLNAVLFHMWEKALGFLHKVAGIILVGSIIIWFLQAFPRDVEYSLDYDGRIAQLESQPAGDQRAAALAQVRNQRAQESMEGSFLGRIGVFVTPVFSPLGFGWQDTVAILTGIVAKEVVVASYAVLYAQGDETTERSQSLRQAMAGTMPPLVAFAFMVFALLYSPCLGTLAAIRREAGSWKWAGFSVAFSLTLAWFLAFGIITIGGLVA